MFYNFILSCNFFASPANAYQVRTLNGENSNTIRVRTSIYILFYKSHGQNRVPPSTLVPGRHPIGQRPPRPDSGRISNGSTGFWLLTPPSATRFQHLPDYGRAIRPAAHTRTRTRRRVIASSRDAAGHFCGRRGRACGRTLTSLCSLFVMYLVRM